MSDCKCNCGVGIGPLLFLLFLGLKLTDSIDWSWWWVTAPLWGPLAVVAAIAVLAGVGAGLAWIAVIVIDTAHEIYRKIRD